MKRLKIEMIHDVVCSWCPVGYQNLRQALTNMRGEIEAQWYFLPFELNPDMPAEGQEIEQHLMERYGWSAEKQKLYRANLVKTAEDAGLIYDFSKRTHYYNTAAAHRLLHWAESLDRQVVVHEALIAHYFAGGMDVGSQVQLIALLDSLGLDAEKAKKEMSSMLFTQQLQRKYDRVKNLALGSVPAFIFNDDHLITGSNSVEFFQQQLLLLAKPPHNFELVARATA
ncbi:DsbA family oxidoreductase [Amphritea sp. HPY]|uniref:DsbA family oxidoreductase n=1 Tax=Amphritea sp. HPY TaxID=3421652 RepID=UPI003D7D9B68